jgi:cell division protein FtsL
MRRGSWGVVLAALGIAALLLSLSLVTWRQSRAREAMAELDALHREISLVRAERAAFERRIQSLESRGHVVPAARERLGMRTPGAASIVLLAPGGSMSILEPDSDPGLDPDSGSDFDVERRP